MTKISSLRSASTQVGLGRGRAVGAFGEDAAVEPAARLAVDHPLDRAGRQHVAGLRRATTSASIAASVDQPLSAPCFVDMVGERAHRQTLRIVVGDRVVADPDHLDAARREAERRMRADVAEALHDRRRVHGLDVERAPSPRKARNATPWPVASRRPSVPPGADRLAGDDLGHGDALVHRIGVHEPGHHLFVGAHVGRHHVDPRARRTGSSPACSGATGSRVRAATARADRPRRRPCRRRRAGRRARISSSSRSRARRSRRCRRWARSACRPWPGPASGDAAPGSPGRLRCGRRPCGSGSETAMARFG